jgi:hypothetical protein
VYLYLAPIGCRFPSSTSLHPGLEGDDGERPQRIGLMNGKMAESVGRQIAGLLPPSTSALSASSTTHPSQLPKMKMTTALFVALCSVVFLASAASAQVSAYTTTTLHTCYYSVFMANTHAMRKITYFYI